MEAPDVRALVFEVGDDAEGVDPVDDDDDDDDDDVDDEDDDDDCLYVVRDVGVDFYVESYTGLCQPITLPHPFASFPIS